MNSRNPDSWRGSRKKSPKEASAAAQTPSWKKDGNSGRKPSSGRAMKARLRLLVPIILLLVLVAIGIFIFRPQGKTHTHFVVLNPLAYSEHFDAAESPVFPMVEGQRFPSGQSSQETPQVLSVDGHPSSGGELGPHDALVVLLQTQILAGPNKDQLICLSKNSTPDLVAGIGESTQFQTVADMKKELISFRKRSPAPILLIVDCLSTVQDRRLGKLPLDTFGVFESWAQDEQLPRLAVIMSSTDSGQSATGPIGSGGQTAFGHIVSQGFSTLADTDKNGELRLSEFFGYVEATVRDWTISHRDLSGQEVQTYPAVGEIDGRLDFTLMKDIPTVESALLYREDKGTAERLNKLWKRRESLGKLMAWRWAPSEWQSSSEFLLRAQEAYLNGNSQSAVRLIDRAERSMSNASQEVTQIASDASDLNQTFGLPRSWFAELPLHESVIELWDQPSKPASRFESATAVLEANHRDYPFEELNIPRPPKVGFRDRAEAISSRLMSVSQFVTQTVKKAESDLLLAEDNAFATSNQDTSPALNNSDNLWNAIELFAEAHQEAEVRYQHILVRSDSLSLLAAESRLDQPDDYFQAWDALLRKNLPNTKMTASVASSLEVEAQQIADKCGPGIDGQLARLRSSIFNLLLWTRVLRSSLYPLEPPEGFSDDELNTMSKALNLPLMKCRQFQEVIDNELVSIATNAGQTVATRSEQVSSYQRHRSLLRVIGISPETRFQLISNVWQLEEQLAQAVTEAAQPSTKSSLRRVAEEALWQVQSLNLLVGNDLQNHPATEVGNIVASVESNELTDINAGQYGKSIRDFFVDLRSKSDKAVYETGPTAVAELRQGDQFARALSAFDSQLLARPPTRSLHTMWQADFALLRADRRLQGLWVLPGESKPWKVNGWYGRVTDFWLSQATALLDSEYASKPAPEFLRNGISERQELFQKTAGISVSVEVKDRLVSIGDQKASKKEVSYSLSTVSITNEIGTAAVSFQPTESSSVSQSVVFEQNGQAESLSPEIADGTVMVSRQGSIPASECESVDYRASVFFRGRRWESGSSFTVDPCPTPEFVVTKSARPPTAAITLAGSDKRPIIFVLDMSGSMDELVEGKTRAQLAIETLGRVIDNLSDDDVVSLKVFGHRMKFRKVVNPDNGDVVFARVPNPKWLRAFNKQLDPNSDIETILMPIRLTTDNRKTVKKVLEELKQSGPWGITPLAGAITEALSGRIIEGNLANRPGVVVAISDGLATDIGRDQDAQPDESLNRIRNLQQALKSSTTSKVVIVALDFEPGTPQRKALETVFEGECKIPVVDARDQNQLLTQIQQSLDPRQYTVQRLTNSETRQQDFGKPIDQLKAPDLYQLTFADLTLADGAPISLKRGDNLQVVVDWANRDFLFLRGKAPEMKSVARGPKPAKDTPTILRAVAPAVYSTYAESGKESVRSVEVSLMLDHERRNLPVQQPEEIEFRIRRLDETASKKVEERFTSEWGAPGWRLRIEDWPAKEYVRVNAFWKMIRTAPELVMECPAADQPGIEIGDQSSLPRAMVTTTVLPGGILRVRLDPVQGVPYAEGNQVIDIRVETGVPDLRNNNQAFRPEELSTTTRRTKTGSLIIDFEGQFTKEALDQVRLAFTSAQSRFSEAFTLLQPLRIDTITTEN